MSSVDSVIYHGDVFKPSCDVVQVVERLEADFGVKVQEVRFPELRYAFRIWDTFMVLPDKEGRVSSPDDLRQSCTLLHVCSGDSFCS